MIVVQNAQVISMTVKQQRALTTLLLLDGLDGHGFPAGRLVDGHLLKVRVLEAAQDGPDVLVDLKALQQCRFAVTQYNTIQYCAIQYNTMQHITI